MEFFVQRYCSPIGNITIKATNNAVISISLSDCEVENKNNITEKAALELSEYFSGKRTKFTFPINTIGTNFQIKVWNELLKIPFGKTVSYGYIAERIGGKHYARAVGSAVNKNPILIAIPCHRVIGQNGSLTGFACGLLVKKYLLNIEGGNYDL